MKRIWESTRQCKQRGTIILSWRWDSRDNVLWENIKLGCTHINNTQLSTPIKVTPRSTLSNPVNSHGSVLRRQMENGYSMKEMVWIAKQGLDRQAKRMFGIQRWATHLQEDEEVELWMQMLLALEGRRWVVVRPRDVAPWNDGAFKPCRFLLLLNQCDGVYI
ncbi:predicted protein [Histoplasma capsulatum G186AR]|uniref:Uncharacterized protein n=1 Tax=Ajellomyces capsulatus (strain G186AR / H82 / ATCC MYA-2454 / RMSCC 2432) TaxID=447093 RepID=C0NUW8_AJECG|nr:uncharacterized protein HCBG_06732 [Histoplasma capsulatum G186AR]EEH04781.1 predicted protein [Histoplasma capsulatum G186AR]